MNEIQNQPLEAGPENAKLVYLLFLASLVFGITSIIGVIMAYMNKEGTEPWLKSHYQYQIRTFWIGILYSVVAFFFVFVVIGYFLFLAILIWVIVRCIKGMKALDQRQEITDPGRWGF